MRVLVTRPRREAERTAARVAALGFEPVVLCLSEVVFPKDALAGALSRKWGAVAVTSTNGVQAIRRQPEAVVIWRHLPFFAVGERTAEAVRDVGFDAIRTGGGNGESLAAAVADAVALGLVASQAEPLLYCAGRPRTGAFENGLAGRGIPCVAVDCYRTEPLAFPTDLLHRTLVDPPVDIALLYSPASASRLVDAIAGAGLAETFRVRRILCLSAAVAAALPDALRSIAATADSPSEDRLLEMLAAIQT